MRLLTLVGLLLAAPLPAVADVSPPVEAADAGVVALPPVDVPLPPDDTSPASQCAKPEVAYRR